MADKQATKPVKAKAEPKAKPAARLTLIVGAANINKGIANMQARMTKLDKDLHVLAVSVIKHSAQHNDPDTATRLLDAMGKSTRKQALTQWMLNYGAFGQDETGKLVYNVKRREQVISDENIKAAEEEPFWDFAPEPAYVQFDLAKAMAALLKKAETALTKQEQDSALIQPDKLAALRAIAAAADAGAVVNENGAGPAA